MLKRCSQHPGISRAGRRVHQPTACADSTHIAPGTAEQAALICLSMEGLPSLFHKVTVVPELLGKYSLQNNSCSAIRSLFCV